MTKSGKGSLTDIVKASSNLTIVDDEERTLEAELERRARQ